MDDPIQELSEIQAEVGAAHKRFEAAQAEGPDRFTGSDEAGAVTVTVDRDGRVHGAVVDQAWQRAVGFDGLAPAVLAAMQAAGAARLEVWATALEEDDSRPRMAAAPPSPSESFAARLAEASDERLDSAQGHAALAALATLLEQLTDGIDQVSAQVDAHSAARFEGRSKAGHVTVDVAGTGELVDVRFDKRWLRSAHEYNIGRELTEAARKAGERAAQHSVADIIAASPLGEMQRLTQDPVEMARRLRLRGN